MSEICQGALPTKVEFVTFNFRCFSEVHCACYYYINDSLDTRTVRPHFLGLEQLQYREIRISPVE
jgi:hypothetical protein